MFCAIVRYSVCVSVPSTMVSVPVVVGCAMFTRFSVVVLPVFSCSVVFVSRDRNVAWFTMMPLMLMYSGSVLYATTNPLTDIAVFITSLVVIDVLLVSVMGRLLAVHAFIIRYVGSALLVLYMLSARVYM